MRSSAVNQRYNIKSVFDCACLIYITGFLLPYIVNKKTPQFTRRNTNINRLLNFYATLFPLTVVDSDLTSPHTLPLFSSVDDLIKLPLSRPRKLVVVFFIRVYLTTLKKKYL